MTDMPMAGGDWGGPIMASVTTSSALAACCGVYVARARVVTVRSLWFRVLGRTVYRRLIVMERRLDEPIARITAGIPAVVSILSDADVDHYAAFRPDTEPAEVR